MVKKYRSLNSNQWKDEVARTNTWNDKMQGLKPTWATESRNYGF